MTCIIRFFHLILFFSKQSFTNTNEFQKYDWGQATLRCNTHLVCNNSVASIVATN